EERSKRVRDARLRLARQESERSRWLRRLDSVSASLPLVAQLEALRERLEVERWEAALPEGCRPWRLAAEQRQQRVQARLVEMLHGDGPLALRVERDVDGALTSVTVVGTAAGRALGLGADERV